MRVALGWRQPTTRETSNQVAPPMSKPPTHQLGDAFPEPYLWTEVSDRLIQQILEALIAKA